MADTFVGTFTVSVQENRILLPSHGLADGAKIRFALGAEYNLLPPPLMENTPYYVVEARGNDFRIASTQGGSAIIITERGTGTNNEVWDMDQDQHPTWQMSSTVTAELPPKDFAVLKLIV
jgi:hypothetical protein